MSNCIALGTDVLYLDYEQIDIEAFYAKRQEAIAFIHPEDIPRNEEGFPEHTRLLLVVSWRVHVRRQVWQLPISRS